MKKFLYTVFMYGACYGAMFEGFASVQNEKSKIERVTLSNQKELQQIVEDAFGVKLEESDKYFLEYFGDMVIKIDDKAASISPNTLFTSGNYFSNDISFFMLRERIFSKALFGDEIAKAALGTVRGNVNCAPLDDADKVTVDSMVYEMKYEDFIATLENKIIKDINEDFKGKLNEEYLEEIGQKIGERIVNEVNEVRPKINDMPIHESIKDGVIQGISEYLSDEISLDVSEEILEEKIKEREEPFELLTQITAEELKTLRPLLKRARATVKLLREKRWSRDLIKTFIDSIYAPLEISFYEEVGIPSDDKAIELSNFYEKGEPFVHNDPNYQNISCYAITFKSYIETMVELKGFSEEGYWELLKLPKKDAQDQLYERYETMLATMQYKKRVPFGNTTILLSLDETRREEYIKSILDRVKLALQDQEARKVLVLFLARNEQFREKTVFVRDNDTYPFVYFGGKMTNVFYKDGLPETYTVQKNDNSENGGAKYKIQVVSNDPKNPNEKEKYWALIHEFRHIILGTLVGYKQPSIYKTMNEYMESKNEYMESKFVKDLFFSNWIDVLFKTYHAYYLGSINSLYPRNAKNINIDDQNREIEKNVLPIGHFNKMVGSATDDQKIKMIGESNGYKWNEFQKNYSGFFAKLQLIDECLGWYHEIEELRNVTGILLFDEKLLVDELNDHKAFGRWLYGRFFPTIFDGVESLTEMCEQLFLDIIKENKSEANTIKYAAFSCLLGLEKEVTDISKRQQEENFEKLGLSSN